MVETIDSSNVEIVKSSSIFVSLKMFVDRSSRNTHYNRNAPDWWPRGLRKGFPPLTRHETLVALSCDPAPRRLTAEISSVKGNYSDAYAAFIQSSGVIQSRGGRAEQASKAG